jgi:hypothetical protein
VTGPRAADDFATIRARMEELRRERERERAGEAKKGRPGEAQVRPGDRICPMVSKSAE